MSDPEKCVDYLDYFPIPQAAKDAFKKQMGFGEDAKEKEEEPARINPASKYAVDEEKQPGAPKFEIDPEEKEEDNQGGPKNEVEMQPQASPKVPKEDHNDQKEEEPIPDKKSNDGASQ